MTQIRGQPNITIPQTHIADADLEINSVCNVLNMLLSELETAKILEDS